MLTALVMIGAIGCGEDDTAATTQQTQPIQQGTEIHLSDGVLQGEVDGGSRRFLGIPYAAPPVGNLRWRPPQPPVPWAGIRPADAFGSACTQGGYLDDQGNPVVNGNEDCLYLNVWTPDPAPTRPLPVMVWFHGGGNQVLSADSQSIVNRLLFDGRVLAEARNVVVVTINYRLGVFGFFGHHALAAEDPHYPYAGNQGLLDQRAALAWVRDNIVAFGGDRNDVTIFGESAGSYDVCLHVVSPGSSGLFHRAISESNGCTLHQDSAADAAPATAQVIATVGCSASPDVLACLRKVPAVNLLLADPLNDGYGNGAFNPTIDGGFLPDQPRALFAAGKFNKVPYLLGSNADEGTFDFVYSPPVTTDEEYLSALHDRYGDLAEQVARVYPSANFPTPQDALARVAGDDENVCQTYDTARRAAAGGAGVYLYNFARAVPVPDYAYLGATHQTEIFYVFGSLDFPTEAEQEVATAIQGYWTRMARTGNPNGDGAVVWPRYADQSDQRINFDIPITVVGGFRRTECEFWWGVYDQAFKSSETSAETVP